MSEASLSARMRFFGGSVRQEEGARGDEDISPNAAQYSLPVDRGNAKAMFELGKLLVYGGDGVAKDLPAAARLYRQAIDRGNVWAMNNLGVLMLMRNGEDGVARDVPAAARLFRQAADLGDADAMFNLGVLLHTGEHGISKDVPAAARLYRQAAELDNVSAMFNLGLLLQKGKDGIRKDVQAAATLYRQGADLGNVSAMFNLGVLLHTGEDGISKDVPAAASLYRQAADLGNASAMFNLGLLLKRGEDGIGKDVQAATRLYRHAADLGDSQAMVNLGLLLQGGEDGIAKDVPAAIRLFRQAADSGNKTAINESAVLLQSGAPHDVQAGIAQQPLRATDPNRCEFNVFISHAGPDKNEVAIPLYERLEARGIRTFVDEADLRVGEEAPEEMQEAMDRASVGVFILSPEFASRRWTLKELICFLERCRGSGRGPKTPALIPVFYRLGVRDCQSRDRDLYGPHSEHGTIILQQGFYDPRRQAETSTEKAMQAMRDLTMFTGIEYDKDGCSVDELIDWMADAVERVVRRQKEREGRRREESDE